MTHDWRSYYANTQELPAASKTAGFLRLVPSGGRVLDVGSGSGRWAAAFLRDRPDLTIDLLDANDDHSVLPIGWKGEKFIADFETFQPTHTYDGVWAFAALFFHQGATREAIFHKLMRALKPGGVFEGTMVDHCETATAMGFHGLSETNFKDLLTSAGLTIVHFEAHAAYYGKEKRPINTWFARACAK